MSRFCFAPLALLSLCSPLVEGMEFWEALTDLTLGAGLLGDLRESASYAASELPGLMDIGGALTGLLAPEPEQQEQVAVRQQNNSAEAFLANPIQYSLDEIRGLPLIAGAFVDGDSGVTSLFRMGSGSKTASISKNSNKAKPTSTAAAIAKALRNFPGIDPAEFERLAETIAEGVANSTAYSMRTKNPLAAAAAAAGLTGEKGSPTAAAAQAVAQLVEPLGFQLQPQQQQQIEKQVEKKVEREAEQQVEQQVQQQLLQQQILQQQQLQLQQQQQQLQEQQMLQQRQLEEQQRRFVQELEKQAEQQAEKQVEQEVQQREMQKQVEQFVPHEFDDQDIESMVVSRDDEQQQTPEKEEQEEQAVALAPTASDAADGPAAALDAAGAATDAATAAADAAAAVDAAAAADAAAALNAAAADSAAADPQRAWTRTHPLGFAQPAADTLFLLKWLSVNPLALAEWKAFVYAQCVAMIGDEEICTKSLKVEPNAVNNGGTNSPWMPNPNP